MDECVHIVLLFSEFLSYRWILWLSEGLVNGEQSLSSFSPNSEGVGEKDFTARVICPHCALVPSGISYLDGRLSMEKNWEKNFQSSEQEGSR